MTLPQLYAKDKSGNIIVWNVKVNGNVVTVEYGREGGAMTSRETVCSGKNIGKRNETSPDEQAVSEAKSLWTKQKDRKGYVENVSDYGSVFFPMLAKDYRNNENAFERALKKAGNPNVVLQPKLNGLRAALEDCVFLSRRRKTYDKMQYLVPELQMAVNEFAMRLGVSATDVIPDGEFFSPGTPLQTIQSLVKAGDIDAIKEHNIDFYVFDVYVKSKPNMKFTERFDILCSIIPSKCVPYLSLNSTDREIIWRCVDEIIETSGDEGGMLRMDMPYDVGNRSTYLWKAKRFMDAEFKIIDIVEVEPLIQTLSDGTHKKKRQAQFLCEMENGERFECRPHGNVDYYEEIATYPERFVGKMLNVKFQEYSLKGIPIFPVGVYIREEE